MAGAIWAIGELDEDGQPTRSTLELATLARGLAAEAGADAVGVVLGAGAAALETAGTAYAAYLPASSRWTCRPPPIDAAAAAVAPALAALVRRAQAGPRADRRLTDGKDLAGVLVGPDRPAGAGQRRRPCAGPMARRPSR